MGILNANGSLKKRGFLKSHLISFPQSPKSSIPQALVSQPSPTPPPLGPFWQEQVGASSVHQEILSRGDDPESLPDAENPSQPPIKCFPRYCWTLIGERGTPRTLYNSPLASLWAQLARGRGAHALPCELASPWEL